MTDWRRPFALKLAQCGFGVDAIRKAMTLAEADVWAHGRHLRDFPIASVGVLCYSGAELRQWRDVRGVDKDAIAPDGVYRLLKSAAELERAAPSFTGVPILKQHPRARMTDDDVVGMLGTVEFADGHLVALDACIHDRAFADQVEGGALPCPSLSYACTTVMQGDEDCDGYQENIVGRHLTFVERGRAGIKLPVAA